MAQLQTTQTTELSDLLDIAYALRSIEQNQIEPWMLGKNELLRPKNPHLGLVTAVRMPVIGVEKHYEVETPNETYTFIVMPNEDDGITNNKVALRVSKTYQEGQRTPGAFIKSDQHELPYLVHWVKTLPIADVTYENAREFFARNNGFETEVRRPELSTFYDQYTRTRADGTKDTLDCYVRIEPKRKNGEKTVILHLDIEVAPKKIK